MPELARDRRELESRIRELGPWYQDIVLADGISTRFVGGASVLFPGHDIPARLWAEIAPRLPDLHGKRVLDIGCNAGYMSFECKRLGAAYVLGIDDDSSASTSFIAQAVFCRDVLGLDVEFRRGSFLELELPRFDVVLFCGVLYHLENWADGLDRLAELVEPTAGRIVLETATEPVTRTTYRGKGYRGDSTTYFVPSLRVLRELLVERGFVLEDVLDLDERALVGLGSRAS